MDEPFAAIKGAYADRYARYPGNVAVMTKIEERQVLD